MPPPPHPLESPSLSHYNGKQSHAPRFYPPPPAVWHPPIGFTPRSSGLGFSTSPPAHAGWVDRVFGTPQEQVSTPSSEKSSATPPVVTSTIPADAIAAASVETTPPEQSPDASLLGNGDEDSATDTDEADTDDATAAEEESGYLPNVEESDLNDDNDADISLSADEVTELGDLWSRLRHGFKMDLSLDNDRIATQRNWYLQHPSYFDRVSRRAARYLHYTLAEAEKRGIPNELALLPVIESAYDPFAYSHANAAGMWQFIPGTAKIMGLKLNPWFDGRRDIIESTRAGYDFLTLLYNKFGDWQLALAAYNAGPGAVQRAINRNVAAGLPTDFWSLRLPAETRAYVPRFLAVAQIVNAPDSYGISLRPVVNKPFFRVVETHGQVDMTKAAQLAGVSLKEFYQLNAGFKRQVTDPEGPHRLLVPAHLPIDFEEQITALPIPEGTVSQTYTVKRGDTLSSLARRFNTTTAHIQQLNKLKKNRLPVGRQITLSRANVSPEFIALSNELHLDRSSSASSKSSPKALAIK